MAEFTVNIHFNQEKFQELVDKFKEEHPDFLEVVRCEKCKWWHHSMCIADTRDGWTSFDFYCAAGERKTE